MVKRCKKTNKCCFKSDIDAKLFIFNFNKYFNSKNIHSNKNNNMIKNLKRTYKCEFCGFYHTTSKPKY